MAGASSLIAGQRVSSLACDVIGLPAKVRAADAFYAFIDGWEGVITGYREGLPVLQVVDAECIAGGFVKEFNVPPEQLEIL